MEEIGNEVKLDGELYIPLNVPLLLWEEDENRDFVGVKDVIICPWVGNIPELFTGFSISLVNKTLNNNNYWYFFFNFHINHIM
jgi:hypothetical protein